MWQARPGSRSGHGRRRVWPRQGDFCSNLQNTEVQGLLRQHSGFSWKIQTPARVFIKATMRHFHF